jgi:hypothetical protein
MLMGGAARCMLDEVETPTACVPKPAPVYGSEILGKLEYFLFEPNVLIGRSSFHTRGTLSNGNSPFKYHEILTHVSD